MKSKIKICLIVIFLSVLITFISCERRPKSDSIITTELEPIKSFGGIDVSEEAILSSPSDMVISEDGEIIVSDSRQNKIYIFDASGNVVKKIGRSGQGPGELLGPRFIAIDDNIIKVFDANNNRIQYFLKNGQSLKTIPCKFNVGMGSFIFGHNEDVYFATNGFRTENLIRHHRETGEQLKPIGKIEGNSFQLYHMLKIRDALIEKEIPDALKNEIILIISSEGRLYVAFYALPLIKIYSSDGELEKVLQLNIPEFEKIKDRCSQANLEEKQKDSPFFWPLRFWRDGAITEKGDLIFLMSDPEKLILFKFNKDGKLIQRYKGIDDDIKMIAVHGPYLWAFGRETHVFYQFKIEK